MKYKKYLRRLFAGVLSGSMILSSFVSADMVSANETKGANVQAAGEISVNPYLHYQTLKGWGTSMCWWGNVIGSWGDKDFNNNGRPDREEIAELAFSPDYLNLNIVRYNVGGGDKPNTSIKRIEGIVPGWTVDMTGSDDGSGVFDESAFYAKKTEEMNDAGQLWMLEQANQYRKEEKDIINEVFSNSPPYYMTKSGSSTGGTNGESNLKTDSYDAFAQYMARATKWIDNDLKAKFGTGVDFVEPMNEPDPSTRYWQDGSHKQEGCAFAQGQEQSDMLNAMAAALEAEGLDDVQITGTDETDLGRSITSFNKLDADAKNIMTTIGVHTYGGDDAQRHTLRKLAASYDKDLWMSEVTKGGGRHSEENHNSMDAVNAKSQSEGIMADLKYMQPTAWIAWLLADSEYECILHNENWGLIQAVFEKDGQPVPGYHDSLLDENGNRKEGVPGEGYWAVTKQFYTMMQYSKFLKAGYTMIEIGDDNMCAALSPDGKELVIVAQNFDNAKRVTSVDLNKFGRVGKAVCYQTSDQASCEKVSEQDAQDGVLNVSLPGYSVSTYVVDVEADMQNYTAYVQADIAKPADAQVAVSGLNKFAYTGEWDGQSTAAEGASASFQFEGSRAVIYGTKAPDAAQISVTVDGGAAKTVSLSSETELQKAVIYDTGTLSNGQHTVTMTVAPGSDEKTFALDGAYRIHGTISAEKGTVIRRVVPFHESLVVYFDEVIGASSYKVTYGTSKDQLTGSVTVSENKAVIKNIANDTLYYIQVEDDLGGKSEIVSAKAGAPDTDVLYFVDAATQNSMPGPGESLGKHNSVLDQEYGEDPVTGKRWGYTSGKGGSVGWQSGDSWHSIRFDSAELEYNFELPQGTYNVAVAMFDHDWKNSNRKTDIVINGDIKGTGIVPTEKTKRVYQASVGSDGNLKVLLKKSEGNSDQDPVLSYIEIKPYDAHAVVSAEPEPIATVSGVRPELPQTVGTIEMSGQTAQSEVIWDDINQASFSAAENSVVKVSGVTKLGGIPLTQEIYIMPCNPVYLIDCHKEDSNAYWAYQKAAGLRNETADQALENGSWGYLGKYGVYDGEELNGGGWYFGGDIQYKVPLDAGKYQVTFASRTWSGWGARSVNYRIYDESHKALASDSVNIGASGATAQKTLQLDLLKEQDVTLSAERGDDEDAVLNWISITKDLDRSKLLPLVKKASWMNYRGEDQAAFDAALSEGKKHLMRSEATQQSVDAATAALNKAMESTLDELVASMEAVSPGGYTAQSYAKLAAAIADAKAVLGEQSASKEEISQAAKKLRDAYKNLVTLESVLKKALEDCKATDSSKYTQKSWSLYDTAYKAAEKMLKEGGYTEAAMEQTVKALKDAFAALEKTAGQPQQPDPVKVKKVAFASKSYQIAAGKKIDLRKELKISPSNASDKSVVWSMAAADKKNASLKNGVVTLKKGKGGKTVKVTATAKDGSGKKATVSIKIMKKAVKKITLKPKSKKVKAGKKLTIKAVVSPKGKDVNTTLKWTSSNTKYATVNAKGVVSAKKAGKNKAVKITAAATDGSGKKAVLKIKITK